jgi:acetolactate synthase I/II/III large subunit
MARPDDLGRRGADVLVDHLVRAKVPYVFGLCGHGNLGLLDALHERRAEVRTVSVHHESAAGFMADAYFRVSHQPVATFTSSGPGSANLPVAVASALADSSAFLAITGNVPTSQFGRGPFQESGRHYQADFPAVMRPYVKRSYQATRPDQVALMVQQAYLTMLQGRPGPVHLDVPLNVFVEPVPEGHETSAASWSPRLAAPPAPDEQAVEEALDLLARARQPVIVAGHGVELSDAEPALRKFAEDLGIPVAHTPLGAGTVDMRSELSLGATGRNGTYAANQATRNADVVLALGTRFDDRATSSWLAGYTYSFPRTKLIHVDIDPQEIGRNYPADLPVVADARRTLERLSAQAEARSWNADALSAWREKVRGWQVAWLEGTRAASSSDGIHPRELLGELRDAMPDDAVLLSDVGVHHNWIVQAWEVREPRTLLQSWGFASMCFGVCGALGAQLAAPDRKVVAVVGDGGFLMMPSAVATAVQYGLPVVWIVWNNRGYVSIRDQQHAFFGPDRELATSFQTEHDRQLYSADFVRMSQAMGADGVTVETPDQLGPALRRALDSDRPFVVDVAMDRDARPFATATWQLPPLPHPEPTFSP